MKDPVGRVLTAVTAMMIMIGSAVPVCAHERSAPLPGGDDFRLGGQDQEQPSLAEQYLFRLAKTSKSQRMVVGGISLAVGAGLLAKGISMLKQENGVIIKIGGLYAVLLGSGFLGSGTLFFMVPSPAERTTKQIQAIVDRIQRERSCEDALVRLAKTARTVRLVQSGIFAFLAASATASMGVDIVPTVLAASALYSILVKSPAEKANRAYLEKKPFKPSPNLVFGFVPRSGFRVGLSMDF